jgi:hypothetical protein
VMKMETVKFTLSKCRVLQLNSLAFLKSELHCYHLHHLSSSYSRLAPSSFVQSVSMSTDPTLNLSKFWVRLEGLKTSSIFVLKTQYKYELIFANNFMWFK